ncbi:MAG: flagellar biosynthesis anti-sigma factor FlgM [Pseudomonadota bacterium]
MTNPINGVSSGGVPLQSGNSKSNAAGKSDGAQGDANTGTADAVSLTNTAESLQELERSLAVDAKISSEKVDAIKQALNSGEYKIDPDLIAEKFLEVERALGKI